MDNNSMLSKSYIEKLVNRVDEMDVLLINKSCKITYKKGIPVVHCAKHDEVPIINSGLDALSNLRVFEYINGKDQFYRQYKEYYNLKFKHR
jgi:hypothetical protein